MSNKASIPEKQDNFIDSKYRNNFFWSTGQMHDIKKQEFSDMIKNNFSTQEIFYELKHYLGTTSYQTLHDRVCDKTKYPVDKPYNVSEIPLTSSVDDRIVSSSLVPTSLEDRQAFLDKHYANRTAWSKDRKHTDLPSSMIKWANENFTDREARGLRLCDLKHLDRPAYDKLQNWRRDKKKYPGDTLPDLIGFPTKRAVNDRLIAAGQVPTSAAVNEALIRGEPDALEKKRRLALYYKRLQKLRKQSKV